VIYVFIRLKLFHKLCASGCNATNYTSQNDNVIHLRNHLFTGQFEAETFCTGSRKTGTKFQDGARVDGSNYEADAREETVRGADKRTC